MIPQVRHSPSPAKKYLLHKSATKLRNGYSSEKTKISINSRGCSPKTSAVNDYKSNGGTSDFKVSALSRFTNSNAIGNQGDACLNGSTSEVVSKNIPNSEKMQVTHSSCRENKISKAEFYNLLTNSNESRKFAANFYESSTKNQVADNKPKLRSSNSKPNLATTQQNKTSNRSVSKNISPQRQGPSQLQQKTQYSSSPNKNGLAQTLLSSNSTKALTSVSKQQSKPVYQNMNTGKVGLRTANGRSIEKKQNFVDILTLDNHKDAMIKNFKAIESITSLGSSKTANKQRNNIMHRSDCGDRLTITVKEEPYEEYQGNQIDMRQTMPPGDYGYDCGNDYNLFSRGVNPAQAVHLQNRTPNLKQKCNGVSRERQMPYTCYNS